MQNPTNIIPKTSNPLKQINSQSPLPQPWQLVRIEPTPIEVKSYRTRNNTPTHRNITTSYSAHSKKNEQSLGRQLVCYIRYTIPLLQDQPTNTRRKSPENASFVFYKKKCSQRITKKTTDTITYQLKYLWEGKAMLCVPFGSKSHIV